jgi:uncharacterized protein (TIRG00374 family)
LKTDKTYKYINLLLRFIIGVLAVYFIYVKIEATFLNDIKNIAINDVNYFYLIVTICLLFLNWGLEAIKWKYTIRNTEIITFIKAFKSTFTGISLGFLTPNRIGEIPARALLLNRSIFKEITIKTGVSSFSQMLITLLFGLVGFIFTFQDFNNIMNPFIWIVILILVFFILLLIYFKTSKVEYLFNKVSFIKKKKYFQGLSDFSSKELLIILLLSLFRYIVFSFQYFLVLLAFGISINGVNEILLIPVCFLIASLIPTILISEIGVRGSVALFVFGTISDMDVQIILASIVLWIINVAIPALLGLLNLKGLKLIKES